MRTDQPPAGKPLAAKIDHLFRTIRAANGREYTYREVAKAIEEAGGPTISSTYLWQLRGGARDNPTKGHLEALAHFFDVPPAYFFDDEAAARIEAELALLVALRDTSVRRIALRAAQLSPRGLEALTTMVEQVRQLEGIADPTPHSEVGTENAAEGVSGAHRDLGPSSAGEA